MRHTSICQPRNVPCRTWYSSCWQVEEPRVLVRSPRTFQPRFHPRSCTFRRGNQSLRDIGKDKREKGTKRKSKKVESVSSSSTHGTASVSTRTGCTIQLYEARGAGVAVDLGLAVSSLARRAKITN